MGIIDKFFKNANTETAIQTKKKVLRIGMLLSRVLKYLEISRER